MAKQPKKNKVGRPSGPEKVIMNITMLKDRKKRLQKLAIDKGESSSYIIESALENVYGI